MRLNDVERIAHGCFACRHAGMPWTVYVKTLYRDPFCCDIYVKKEDEGSGFRKRKVFFCPTHASVLVADWVNIIKQELDLARAFDQYMDRMER